MKNISQTVLGALIGPSFKPLGGHKDGSADGFVDLDIWEQTDKPNRFFQASKTLDVEKKIRDTVARLEEVDREVDLLYYASSLIVPYIDKLEMTLSDELGVTVEIYDRNVFAQRANFNKDVEAAGIQYPSGLRFSSLTSWLPLLTRLSPSSKTLRRSVHSSRTSLSDKSVRPKLWKAFAMDY